MTDTNNFYFQCMISIVYLTNLNNFYLHYISILPYIETMAVFFNNRVTSNVLRKKKLLLDFLLSRACDFFFALKELIIFKNTLLGTYTVIMRLTTTQYIVNIRDKTFWLAKRVSVSERYRSYSVIRHTVFSRKICLSVAN